MHHQAGGCYQWQGIPFPLRCASHQQKPAQKGAVAVAELLAVFATCVQKASDGGDAYSSKMKIVLPVGVAVAELSGQHGNQVN
ncbi:MAG: hypothetical protein ACRYFZ_02805 [Janthinobacterium lividum]